MRDLCPHRGIPLSAGWFDGETVQCKYHGWRFEPCGGQCQEIPSLTSFDALTPTKIFASTFPVVERDGYAWVYVPAAARGGQVCCRMALLTLPRCRLRPNCRNLARASAPRTSPRTFRATWTMASSA